MLVIFFGLLFLCLARPVQAQQIPLYYQLLFAYKPNSLNVTPNQNPISSPDSTSSAAPQPQVLGVATNIPSTSLSPTATPSPVPTLPAIGGDGKVVTIAVLGDSMIDTLQPGLPQLLAALKKYYPNIKFNIINFGVGASNIEYALYRLNNNYEYLGEKHPSLISQQPDIVVVESFAYNNFGNTQAGIDRQWLALGAVTSTIKEKLPQSKIVLAATIAPNSIIFANNVPGTHFSALEKIEKTTTIKLYLQNLINFATSQNFPLADAYHPSLINNEGNKDYINTGDNIHPSGPGGEFFCSLVAKTISDNQLIAN